MFQLLRAFTLHLACMKRADEMHPNVDGIYTEHFFFFLFYSPTYMNLGI
jgi:hypothetical protein